VAQLDTTAWQVPLTHWWSKPQSADPLQGGAVQVPLAQLPEQQLPSSTQATPTPRHSPAQRSPVSVRAQTPLQQSALALQVASVPAHEAQCPWKHVPLQQSAFPAHASRSAPQQMLPSRHWPLQQWA
jgi:hypothetical protein